MGDAVSITNFGLSPYDKPTAFVHVNVERECPTEEFAQSLVALHNAVIAELCKTFPVYVRKKPEAFVQRFFDRSPALYFAARYSVGTADYAPAGLQLSALPSY